MSAFSRKSNPPAPVSSHDGKETRVQEPQSSSLALTADIVDAER